MVVVENIENQNIKRSLQEDNDTKIEPYKFNSLGTATL